MSEELIEVKPEFAHINNTGYAGGFPPNVSLLISQLIQSPSLHLFSGTSKIGDVRVDLKRPEATLNANVFDFIEQDREYWKFVIADPPYQIKHRSSKLRDYGKPFSISGSVPMREKIESWIQTHAENVLWFDFVSPCPQGFHRYKMWAFCFSSWRHVRVLTWLKRKGERLA